MDGDKPIRLNFKRDPCGYVDTDIAEGRTSKGEPYLLWSLSERASLLWGYF
jgi:hypothetical protein